MRTVCTHCCRGSDGRDQALVPIAIELKARPAKGADQSAVTATSGWVYSRQELARDPQKQVRSSQIFF